MDKMRAAVAQLEAQKRKLLSMLPPAEDARQPQEDENEDEDVREPEPPASPVGDDAQAPRRQEFVRLAAEIEALRTANAALASSLRERDMFTSAMQNLMLEFDRPVDLSELFDDEDSVDCHRPAKPKRGPPAGDVGFTPLTMDEAQATVRATLQQMASARAAHLSDANNERGAKFFGWSEYTYRKHTTISFALKKLLPNTVPRALLAATWGFITDSSSTAKLIRPQLSAKYTPLQMLGPDMLVIDRRTEDQCRVGVGGKMLAMRTVYLLFWTKVPASVDANGDADGDSEDAYVLAMKTIDLPLVKRMLRPDEVWCDIFYWIRFAADGKVVDTSEGGTSATLAEFGGVNTYVREEIASSWLAELVFLAIRWETLAVAPCLLKN
jgi:hypothetical protein